MLRTLDVVVGATGRAPDREKCKRLILRLYPRCAPGCGRRAVDVYEIDDSGDLESDESNLEGLCEPCQAPSRRLIGVTARCRRGMDLDARPARVKGSRRVLERRVPITIGSRRKFTGQEMMLPVGDRVLSRVIAHMHTLPSA